MQVMQFKAIVKPDSWLTGGSNRKLFLIMKLITIFLFAGALHVSANGLAQKVSIRVKDAPLVEVFNEIKRQTNFTIFYNYRLLENARPVTLDLKNATIEEALNASLKDQSLTYSIVKQSIVIKIRGTEQSPLAKQILAPLLVPVTGKITDEQNMPLSGVSITVKNKPARGTSTNANGRFSLEAEEGDILIITSVEYLGITVKITRSGSGSFTTSIIDREKAPKNAEQEIAASNSGNREVNSTSRLIVTTEYKADGVQSENGEAHSLALNFILLKKDRTLEEVVALAYGKTTLRNKTGSVSRVTANEIDRMPISNPLSALIGRVTGLEISQTNGLPGSTFNVLIRGQGSLHRGTLPLYVIDGVPFMQNQTGNTLHSDMSPSPLNGVNPADIESIEVLKDADATAIYGSQGANGVILITTKKAQNEKTNVIVNYYMGSGKVTRVAKPMNTQQYISMRRKAFQNDGVNPTLSNAPDLVLFDTTSYTDWQEVFTGGTSTIHNVEASVSGGSGGTRFLLSGNYNSQTTVYPESKPVQRASGYFNVSHQSPNKKFGVQLSGIVSDFYIQAPPQGLGGSIYIPPNAPALYDSLGNINWNAWVGVTNPAGDLKKEYKSHTYLFNYNVDLNYRVLPSLTIKMLTGYNQQRQDEYRKTPISASRPSPNNRGSADWQKSGVINWMFEPQATWQKQFGNFRAELIAGMNWQNRKQEAFALSGTQYTDDDLLGNPQSAGQLATTYSSSQYRYMAYFSRATLQWHQRYLFSLNFRRDGSSRFGPDTRFSNFGSVAAGWIFSEEPWLKKLIPFLSFGKLRSSYGISGNDQVNDYAFLDAWTTPTTGNYQGNATLAPTSLFNPSLHWERNKKLEAAIELGLFKNRILINTNWYQNHCDNQLISNLLPSQTGYTGITSNRNALIENTGWEFEIETRNILKSAFSWKTSFNLSIPRSELIRYPDLEKTSNRFTYAIGEPLDIRFGYQYIGIDPQKNIYTFEDINKDGVLNSTFDYKIIGQISKSMYGGLINLFHYRRFELEIALQGVKQTGRNYLGTLATVPGNLGNQPSLILGESLQKYTSLGSGEVVTAYRNFRNSSAYITDASYIRLRNLSFTYRLPENLLRRMHMRLLDLYMQGQNLFTITNYKGADPETNSVTSVPPIKMLVFGIKMGL